MRVAEVWAGTWRAGAVGLALAAVGAGAVALGASNGQSPDSNQSDSNTSTSDTRGNGIPTPSPSPSRALVPHPCDLITNMSGGSLLQYTCRDANGRLVYATVRDGELTTSADKASGLQVDKGTQTLQLESGSKLVYRRSVPPTDGDVTINY